MFMLRMIRVSHHMIWYHVHGQVTVDDPHTPVTAMQGGRELRPRAPKEAPNADKAVSS